MSPWTYLLAAGAFEIAWSQSLKPTEGFTRPVPTIICIVLSALTLVCLARAARDIPITYVPARNTIFLSVALGWAEVLGASDLFIGVNAVDYSGYPDCRPEFIRAFESLARPMRDLGWDYAVGTSGTAKALVQIARLQFGAERLDRPALERLRAALLAAGHADRLELAGLKPDRRPVLAGGLAVMMAAFDEFGIESLDYCEGALRHGVLHDLLGRDTVADPRRLTVKRMIDRLGIDLLTIGDYHLLGATVMAWVGIGIVSVVAVLGPSATRGS